MVEQLRRQADQIKDMEKLVSYVVLDDLMPPGYAVDDVDGHGRRYLIWSPQQLDELAHRAPDSTTFPPGPSLGIAVYRREDMAPGWPHFTQSQAA